LTPYKTFLLALATVALIIDILTKDMVVQSMALYESIEVIPGILNFTYIRNMGVAFGLFSEYNAAMVLSAISGIAIIFLSYLFHSTGEDKKLELLGIALIISGAAGNLIDRIQMQGVIDFIDVFWKEHHWPAFNVADSAITIGMAVFIYSLLTTKEEPTPKKTEDEEDPFT